MSSPRATPDQGHAGTGSWGPGDVVCLALALGCLFGLGEVAVLAWRRFVMVRVTHVTPHVAWMAPLGYSALLLAVAPIPILLQRIGPRWKAPHPPLWLFGAIGLMGWIAMTPWRLHPVAVALFGLGGAHVLAGIASRRGVPSRGALRGTTTGLIAVTLMAGSAVVVHERRAERNALGALPPAAPGAPSVLLIILDTVRAASLGLHGYERPTTPFLESLAASGTLFETAIAPAPWTLPSHASMFTGRWPHELSARWLTPLDDTYPTIVEVLASRGYVTAGFVANLGYTSRQYGLDRGFAHYEDFPVGPGQIVLATGVGRWMASLDGLRERVGHHELLNRKTAGRIRRDFLDWLDDQPRRPFFAFLNLYDAHEPYLPPPPFEGRFAERSASPTFRHYWSIYTGSGAVLEEKWQLPRAEVERARARYEESIASIDAELGRLVGALRAREELRNTLLVVTSDHGELFGSRGMFGHLNGLYLPLLHVPLLIHLPGRVPRGVRVRDPVSLRDLSATILDLVGSAGSKRLPGTSLREAWQREGSRSGRSSGAASSSSPGAASSSSPGRGLSSPFAELRRVVLLRDWYPIARGEPMFSLVGRAHQYICNPDGTEELYRVKDGPDSPELIESGEATDSVVGAFRERLREVELPPSECPPPRGAAPRPGRTRPPGGD